MAAEAELIAPNPQHILFDLACNDTLYILLEFNSFNHANYLYIRSLSSFFYLLFGTICYYQNFDRTLQKHPKFRRNQIRSEIADSLFALFGLNVLTVPIFLAQVRNLSKIYKFGSGSLWYEVAQYPFFVLFSDTGMYWLHRVFHHPLLFKMCHIQHHQ